VQDRALGPATRPTTSLPEVRWALLTTVLFAAGRLLLRLAAVPSSLTGVVFAGYYLAGSELGITEVYASAAARGQGEASADHA